MSVLAASSLLLGTLLSQAPEGGGRPIPATATADGAGFYLAGLDPFSQQWERGMGSATVSVRDRVQVPNAAAGDEGQASIHFTLGITAYDIQLRRAGFPPSALPGGRKPPYAVGGGVVLDHDVYGPTGLGEPLTRAHAVFALWGVGSVSRDGVVLTDRAVIQVMALSDGTHADDETFVMQRQARPRDGELLVLATNLPTSAEPRGFIEVGFDDVRLSLDGVTVPTEPFIPTDGVAGQSPAQATGTRLLASSNAPTPSTTVSIAPLSAGKPISTAAGLSGATTTFATPSTTSSGPSSVATGIPATPPVANDGAGVAPLQQAPAPGNAQPASGLVTTIAPANTGPASGGPSPLETNIAPLNGAPATPLPSAPAPGNATTAAALPPGTPLPTGIPPLNALPATPLPGAVPALPSGR